MKNIYYTIVLVLMLPIASYSQSPTEHNFTVESTKINVGGTEVNVHSELAKSGPVLNWTQRSDRMQRSEAFHIINELGTLNDRGYGNLILDLAQGNDRYRLTVNSSSSGVTALLTFQHTDGTDGLYSFEIDRIIIH